MKHLTEKDLKSINAGDFWEDLGTATGNVITRIPKLGKSKSKDDK
ncbi:MULTISPECIES: hypothetical protein [Staphylococcus]|nr:MULTISPECIES: hypothetical protein [Staphylococcus]KDP53442.1 hypothetical protein CO98_2139 [Staphylococcus aureus subsp. aureus CO-98]MDI1499270.1 hypothetical protein [Staphylococcus aureus]MDI1513826.1 hypothetical protein [Staphylococcus aureus]MDI1596153.1 hypothetical protein [Staphylococcus aureus]MDI1644868.1 hypothetical protein [Staphylococcus aureus]